MSSLHAFFIQYQVNSGSNPGKIPLGPIAQGIATIIVFAESEATARRRAGRIVADRNMEITDLLRIHLLRPSYIDILDTMLRSLYNRAELYGIAVHCDLFPTNTSCCNTEGNQPE